MNAKTVLPAVAMTAVSMVLTLAVVVMWRARRCRGPSPWSSVSASTADGWPPSPTRRRLAAQGDHSHAVTGVGWSFGLIAAGVLIAHALTAEASAGAWLAVAWLPIAAKAPRLVHGLWERTALTPNALGAIRESSRKPATKWLVARARLRAEAVTEETGSPP